MTMALEQPKSSAVAVNRVYEPLAPAGTSNFLKGLLEKQRDGIAQALPKHITPERLIKTMLVAANRNPDILKCTQASIMETINRAAELGLDLSGTLGEAYPVPFNNKIKFKDPDGRERETWAMQLQLIIGYRGMEKLAWQSGEVESIDAEVVCANDSFVFKKGTTVLVEWTPCLTGDRGEIIGAYACVSIKGGGKLARFLPTVDLIKIRNSSKSKDSPAWRNWLEEMYRKCALKRTLKDAPLSTEKFVKAMEIDSEDYELTDVLQAQTQNAPGVTKTKALANKFSAPELPPGDSDSQIDPAADASHENQVENHGAPPPCQEPPTSAQEMAGAGEGENLGNDAPAEPVLSDDPIEAELVKYCVHHKPTFLTAEQATAHVKNAVKLMPKPYSKQTAEKHKLVADAARRGEWPTWPNPNAD